MKKITLMTITVSAFIAFAMQAADDNKNDKNGPAKVRGERRDAKVDIDKRVREINKLDNSNDAMLAGMAAVSKETAVPLPTIQAEHKEHPKVGLAGLFVAHELATHTHEPVDKFIGRNSRRDRRWVDV